MSWLALHDGDLFGSEAVELVDEGVDLAVGEGELGLKLPQGVGFLFRRLFPVQVQHPVHELHQRRASPRRRGCRSRCGGVGIFFIY